MKTNDLRKTVRNILIGLKTTYTTITDVYYREADDNALYPHILFSFDSSIMNSDDRNRNDYQLIIDVYDKSASFALVENIADSIELALNSMNLPQTNVLPTIYLDGRTSVYDQDKQIKHIQLRFTLQNYTR